MVDIAGDCANLNGSMTGKTRNWLAALCILAFPVAVFVGFLIYDLNHPESADPRNAATNAAPPAPTTATNAVERP